MTVAPKIAVIGSCQVAGIAAAARRLLPDPPGTLCASRSEAGAKKSYLLIEICDISLLR
jgi:hypothetical protein